MSQNKDRDICEALGICWHVYIPEYEHLNGTLVETGKHCVKCDYISNGYDYDNPDFTTDSGKPMGIDHNI